ncbi:MAG TPA: hypothetical protein VLK33_08180 [Terriglobales bacterium]|nr:hypothetical protein [Terriglobales bacterium]
MKTNNVDADNIRVKITIAIMALVTVASIGIAVGEKIATSETLWSAQLKLNDQLASWREVMQGRVTVLETKVSALEPKVDTSSSTLASIRREVDMIQNQSSEQKYPKTGLMDVSRDSKSQTQ